MDFKKDMRLRLKTYILLILTLAFFSACKINSVGSVEREELFSLEIGPMEDQIALYKLEGNMGIRRTGFTMREGLFYIADGNAGKIVRYNSYGDLLFMIYNEETNPAPITLKTNISGEEQTTRWAYTYPLDAPGWITVDSRRHIFAEDRLAEQAHRTDPESRAVLDGIILHFDQDGRFINYLGREGIGGSPFPRIVGLTTSAKDELTVICRIPDGWNVYWYNSSGALLYLVKIASEAIPSSKEWPQAITAVDHVAAAPDARKIYIKADYSRDTFDQLTNTRTGSEPVSSVIWILDVEDGSYSGSIEVPLYEFSENNHSADIKVFYSMIGVMRGGKVLLYFPVETGFSILFVDSHSREQRRGILNFFIDELRYNDFFLSPDGILCAMFADNFNVKFLWWRTDKFIGGSP
ncbi:LIC_12708 family protein [Treponema sp. R6D11]